MNNMVILFETPTVSLSFESYRTCLGKNLREIALYNTSFKLSNVKGLAYIQLYRTSTKHTGKNAKIPHCRKKRNIGENMVWSSCNLLLL